MAKEIQMEGLDGLLDKFQALETKVAKQALRKALKAGGDVFKKEIVARAPQKTGQLKAEIASATSINANEGTGIVSVGPLKHAYHGMFAEFGTRHQPAKPFLRPAFDGKADDALNAFAEVLKDAVDEASR